jgi:hypothetical protein
MSGSLSRVVVGASTGVEGVARVMVAAETLTHRDRGVLPTSLWFLVDRRVPVGTLRGRALASIELVSSRQQAFGLLRRRTLEQVVNLVVGPTILGRCGLWKAMEQGRHDGDVLACPGEAREGFIIGDDPSVHVAGHGAGAPTISAALDVLIELRAFLLELESCLLDVSVSGFQLLHRHAWRGRCLPLCLVVEVVCWGSLLLVDAFDVPLGGTRHEAFTRGVVASPAGVRARGRLWLLCQEVVERFRDVFDHPHEFVVRGRWDHALCHKVANSRHGVAETERKHRRGAPYEVFRREGFPSGEPRHDVGVRKEEAVRVLPGQLGSQGDTELALKPPIVEVDGGERLDGGVSQCQLSSHRDDEFQVPKAHACVRDPADTVASHH